MTLQPYVHVEERIGESYFPRCTADMFDLGVLTISSLDDGEDVRVFPPGSWSYATVFDASHHVLFAIDLRAQPTRAFSEEGVAHAGRR